MARPGSRSYRSRARNCCSRTSKVGKRNWDFGLSSAAPKKRRQFPDLRHIAVHDADLVYRNGETGARTELRIASLDVTEPDPASPVTIAATVNERLLGRQIDAIFISDLLLVKDSISG